MLCSALMLFFPAFSPQFYITYILCGLSDMIDGPIARKTNSAGEFGAKLDTIADIMFAAVVMIKLLPAIQIPKWLWIWIIAILLIKITGMIQGFIRRKKLISMHTIMNKATGLLLFLLPMTMTFIDLEYSSSVVCFIATFSAIQENYYIASGREII